MEITKEMKEGREVLDSQVDTSFSQLAHSKENVGSGAVGELENRTNCGAEVDEGHLFIHKTLFIRG